MLIVTFDGGTVLLGNSGDVLQVIEDDEEPGKGGEFMSAKTV